MTVWALIAGTLLSLGAMVARTAHPPSLGSAITGKSMNA
jgi:hypothetical protein